jgi:hypothetical protein
MRAICERNKDRISTAKFTARRQSGSPIAKQRRSVRDAAYGLDSLVSPLNIWSKAAGKYPRD